MAKRQVFFSFHFANDVWRASQVRNMGVIEGNSPVSDNEWEEVKKNGDAGIEKWIDEQLQYRSCAIVLIGNQTATRPWVRHEIKRAWALNKGVVGIYIHNLKNQGGLQTSKGGNPFATFTFGQGKTFDQVVKAYDPPHTTSTDTYAYIKENIDSWAEEAIKIREKY
jgi:hypothetical protein